jgi:pSer/pThr/pTyr-binding forkhead associated (FHA) protein
MTRLQLSSSKYQFKSKAGQDCFVVGRLADCDLVVAEPSVSRVHAELFWRPAGWCVRDLDSRHGIWVNGKPVEMTRLRDGDALKLGDLILDVKLIRESPISSARLQKAAAANAAGGQPRRPVIRIGDRGGATTMMRVQSDED